MSRRNSEAADSLDMLLDTMCNTFGGIILIALLISLLVRDITPATDQPPSPMATNEVWSEYTNALARKADLLSDVSALSNKVKLSEDVQAVRQRLRLAAQSSEQRAKQEADLNRTIAAEENGQRELDAKVTELKARCQQLSSELERRTKPNDVSITAPRMIHQTGKKSWGILVKGGRAYPLDPVSRAGWASSASLAVTVLERWPVGGRYRLEPKPKGTERESVDVTTGPQPLEPLLPPPNVRHEYLVVFLLHADSFQWFAPLRQSVVEKRLSYNVVFYADEIVISVGAGPVEGTSTP